MIQFASSGYALPECLVYASNLRTFCSSSAQTFVRENAFAYKVAHLEVGKTPRSENCANAVRTAQSVAEQLLKTRTQSRWVITQVVSYAKLCDHSTLAFGKELNFGSIVNVDGTKIMDMLQPSCCSPMHDLSEQLAVINQRIFVNGAGKKPLFFKNPIVQSTYAQLSPYHKAVYSFTFDKFRSLPAKTAPSSSLQTSTMDQEATEQPMSPQTVQTPLSVSASLQAAAPKKSKRQHHANLQPDNQPALEDVVARDAISLYWSVTTRFLSGSQATYVMYDRKKTAHVLNFFQYEATDVVRAVCTCDEFQHLRMLQINPSATGAVSAELTKCTHIGLILEKACAALLSVLIGNSEDPVLHQIIHAHSDRLWSILDEDTVFLVEKSRQSYVCRSCTTCNHAQQVMSVADNGHVQVRKHEMEACPWLTCEGNTPKCSDCFSNYCPSTDLLMAETPAEKQQSKAAIIQTMRWAVSNADGDKPILAGTACKPCFCESHSAVETVCVDAFIFSLNAVNVVQLKHQVQTASVCALPRMFCPLSDLLMSQICRECKQVVDTIDEDNDLWFFEPPTASKAQYGITVHLAAQFLKKLCKEGALFSSLFHCASEVLGGASSLCGVPYVRKLNLFEQVRICQRFLAALLTPVDLKNIVSCLAKMLESADIPQACSTMYYDLCCLATCNLTLLARDFHHVTFDGTPCGIKVDRLSGLGALPLEQNCSECQVIPPNAMFKRGDRLFVPSASVRSAILQCGGEGGLKHLIAQCRSEQAGELELIFKQIASLDQESFKAVLGL